MTSKTIATNTNMDTNIDNSTNKKSNLKSGINYKAYIITALFWIASFFIGRANIFNTLNPIAVAFMGTLLFNRNIFYISSLSVLMGLLSKSDAYYIFKYILCIGIMIFLNLFLKSSKSNKKPKVLTKAIICTGSIFVSGMMVTILNGFSGYYFVVAILESALTFCLFFVLNIGVQTLLKTHKLNTFNVLKTLTNEQIISLSILVASILYGTAYLELSISILNFNINNFNFSFTYFLVFIFLMFVSYVYGSVVGTTFAIMSSYFLIINNIINTDFLIIFTLASGVSGVFREKSKLLFTISFNICIMVMLINFDINFSNLSNFDTTNNLNYFNNISLQTVNYLMCIMYSLFLGSIIFLVSPIRNNNISRVNKISKISKSTNTSTSKTKKINSNNVIVVKHLSNNEKIQMLTTDKILNYAQSFQKLSKTFSNLAEKKTNLEQQDISNLIDDVVDQVCHNCDIRVFCWEKKFYDTYQKVFNIIDFYDNSDNNLNNMDYSNNYNYNSFIDNCVQADLFINVLNKSFEIYKLNLLWKNKVIESRELVGKQLTGVSDIMIQVSNTLCQDVNFLESLEIKIFNHLKDNGIIVKNVIATENQKNRLEILLKVEPCYVPNTCVKTIIPLVNSIVNKKMYRDCNDCIIQKDENNNSICTIKLIEEAVFRVNSYAISIGKDGTNQCGDSHSFLNLPAGGYMLALSDGMGSGAIAKAESKATIELLEDFMLSGFSRELAINMINSALFFKSSKETFATLDICNIDLYTGMCEFIKIGAVSTFILHDSLYMNNDSNKLNSVEVIEMASLPVGILDTIEADVTRKKLHVGDIIIMVTDGVTDSNINKTSLLDKYDINNNEAWIIELLENNKSQSPEDIAKKIIEQSKKNYQIKHTNDHINNIKTKNIIQDDITVMVARIW
ncbi:MAG: SpoIIE family protein phosphatase [bacterium]